MRERLGLITNISHSYPEEVLISKSRKTPLRQEINDSLHLGGHQKNFQELVDDIMWPTSQSYFHVSCLCS